MGIVRRPLLSQQVRKSQARCLSFEFWWWPLYWPLQYLQFQSKGGNSGGWQQQQRKGKGFDIGGIFQKKIQAKKGIIGKIISAKKSILGKILKPIQAIKSKKIQLLGKLLKPKIGLIQKKFSKLSSKKSSSSSGWQ